MKTLRVILGDQLSEKISSLSDLNTATDIVMLCEVRAEATYVKHHQLKIAFLFSAMRHFADDLSRKDINIHYVKLDDNNNTHSFSDEILRACKFFSPDKVIVTEAGEYRVQELFVELKKQLPIPLEIRVDDRYFCTRAEFSAWADDKNQLRMESFYRHMRIKHHILVNLDKTPEGGKWNYDTENRKPISPKLHFPQRPTFKLDAITQEVLTLVKKHFGDHFGNLGNFYFAVTRQQALKLLNYFINYILPDFGDYQDAMTSSEAFLFHSVLSPYINCGLLSCKEVCEKAEAAFHHKSAPLNAVEGFIRQILGWREYMRGVYWLKMPDYAKKNYFEAARPLPDFYWTGNTAMNCLHNVVQQTADHAYSHHIQRLMITGNFALLAGLSPLAVCEWYLIVYADAYEWVELPNTLAMSLYADGGFLGSKPYAAGGNYINRMSDFCKACEFSPKITVGEGACPFNSLYWHFLIRQRDKIGNNMRLKFPYASWDKMDAKKRAQILLTAENFLKSSAELTSTY
jgi:deoxyribodipyrimidine photolyase-related protein